MLIAFDVSSSVFSFCICINILSRYLIAYTIITYITIITYNGIYNLEYIKK